MHFSLEPLSLVMIIVGESQFAKAREVEMLGRSKIALIWVFPVDLPIDRVLNPKQVFELIQLLLILKVLNIFYLLIQQLRNIVVSCLIVQIALIFIFNIQNEFLDIFRRLLLQWLVL